MRHGCISKKIYQHQSFAVSNSAPSRDFCGAQEISNNAHIHIIKSAFTTLAIRTHKILLRVLQNACFRHVSAHAVTARPCCLGDFGVDKARISSRHRALNRGDMHIEIDALDDVPDM